MRILMWTSSYPPAVGGMEVVVSELARGMAARGDAVHVVTQPASGGETVPSATEADPAVCRLPFHQVLASRDPARVAALDMEVDAVLERARPDVVHAHALHPGLFFLLRAMDRRRRPLIFTAHGWPGEASGIASLHTRMLRRADIVTACSRYIVERAIGELPAVANRAVAIWNGCRDPGLPIQALSFDPPRLLCVGRLVAEKGFGDVLRAMPAVVARHPAARLTIVGDGPHRQTLSDDCVRLGLEASVTFAGALPRTAVFGAMNAATAVIVPSRGEEGLSMAAIEASLMARPVIGTRSGGLPEAVVDGRTGLLVQPGDRTGLAAAILRLLDEPDLAVRLGSAGRRRAAKRFDWASQVTAYRSLYGRVAATTTEGERTP